MNKIYLNDELKELYSKALQKELSIGEIDKGISEHLIAINKSDNIRTIFSQRGNKDIGKGNRTYLRIAYTSKIEKRLFKEIIPEMTMLFERDLRGVFRWHETQPRISSELREENEHNKGAIWLVGTNYFNISTIYFTLDDYDIESGDKFWHELRNQLCVL
jgi:hypothetical protein